MMAACLPDKARHRWLFALQLHAVMTVIARHPRGNAMTFGCESRSRLFQSLTHNKSAWWQKPA